MVADHSIHGLIGYAERWELQLPAFCFCDTLDTLDTVEYHLPIFSLIQIHNKNNVQQNIKNFTLYCVNCVSVEKSTLSTVS